MPVTLEGESTLTDIAIHPERLQAVDVTLVQRIQSLTGRVEVNLDAPLSVDDE
jgi:antitoxin PrlF